MKCKSDKITLVEFLYSLLDFLEAVITDVKDGECQGGFCKDNNAMHIKNLEIAPRLILLIEKYNKPNKLSNSDYNFINMSLNKLKKLLYTKQQAQKRWALQKLS